MTVGLAADIALACLAQMMIVVFVQVRVIVERLARRCGYDAVSAKIPEGDMRLLTHIRKDATRKAKLKRARVSAGTPSKSMVLQSLVWLCNVVILQLNPSVAPEHGCEPRLIHYYSWARVF